MVASRRVFKAFQWDVLDRSSGSSEGDLKISPWNCGGGSGVWSWLSWVPAPCGLENREGVPPQGSCDAQSSSALGCVG